MLFLKIADFILAEVGGQNCNYCACLCRVQKTIRKYGQFKVFFRLLLLKPGDLEDDFFIDFIEISPLDKTVEKTGADFNSLPVCTTIYVQMISQQLHFIFLLLTSNYFPVTQNSKTRVEYKKLHKEQFYQMKKLY